MNKWNLEQDYKDISNADFIPWDLLRGKTIFITGATGLIGTSLINALLYVNKEKNLQIKILALVRDLDRALQKFSMQHKCAQNNQDTTQNPNIYPTLNTTPNTTQDPTLHFIVGSVEDLPKVAESITDSIDYIIHGASQTASKEFVTHPVETIQTSVLGTINTLEFAKRKFTTKNKDSDDDKNKESEYSLARDKGAHGYVYLSSMEMYGYPEKGHIVLEEEAGALSPLDLRNSYPISKQICEALCCAYAKEYGIPAKIARLTQTFGPGVHYDDNRIFAYFARCSTEKKNIILKTKGETERCYLYTADAVTAILTILLKGEIGQAYNCANEKTYCSIAEMAQTVAKEAGISVEYQTESETENCTKNYFPKTLYMHLGTEKLRNLGWESTGGVSNWLRCIEGC